VEATYYAFIEEIWELAYGPLKAALFYCQWVWLEEITTDSEGFTTVDLTKTAYKDDPFVLARDVMQVLYVKDNKSPRREKVSMDSRTKKTTRAIRKCLHSGRTYPYLSLKRVTNLLTYGLITMRLSLLIHLS
jgi:hypothetical protein